MSAAHSDLIKAKLVYDYSDKGVMVPSEMGIPRADQMCGRDAEQLTEVGGRVCYDSLGKGRPSFTRDCNECGGGGDNNFGEGDCPKCKGKGKEQGYHDHILEVKHGSVLEHYNFTVAIPFLGFGSPANITERICFAAVECLNRPGIVCFRHEDSLRITTNLRSVLEWDSWTQELGHFHCVHQHSLTYHLGNCLYGFGTIAAPHIIRSREPIEPMWTAFSDATLSKPTNDHERWVSLYLAGSRGWSHEQVRHGDFTAISQRSTRYVDESESPWVEHPLITKWKSEQEQREVTYLSDTPCEDEARKQYAGCVKTLEPWLASKGVDRFSARKQARGAARGYLGNALATDMIFSANVAQWKRILKQRGNEAADAEIRAQAVLVLKCLQESQYCDRFTEFTVEDSKDGIGQCVRFNGK